MSSIPLSVAVGGDPAGTFRKMVLVDSDKQTAAPAAVWKTPERIKEPTAVQPPAAPLRPNRLPGLVHSPRADINMAPLATSTPERHPIHALAAVEAEKQHTVMPSEQRDYAPRQSNDGGEWTQLVEYRRRGDEDAEPAAVVQASRAERCVAPAIPIRQRARFNRLLDYLRTFADDNRAAPISASEHGELKTDDGPVRGTSYADVLCALFTNSRYQTAGLCEAVAALRKAGAPVDLIGSRRAADLFNMGGHTVGQGGAGRLRNDAPPGRAPRVLRVYK